MDGPDKYAPQGTLCVDCGKEFKISFLYENFDDLVCDRCYNIYKDDKYALITKSDAKEHYLLTDNELESTFDSSLSLKCIQKKNSKYSRFGIMKLFLKSQVFFCIFLTKIKIRDRFGIF